MKRREEEARAERAKRQATPQQLQGKQAKVGLEAALASKDAELKELRASVRMLQQRVGDSAGDTAGQGQ